jgi:predicted nucleotidyltransferase
MNKSIFKKDINRIINITKRSGADKAILFGSCLENIDSAHDIDIAVEGVNPLKFFDMYGEILSSVNENVDIIPMEDARHHLYESINKYGKVLYER